MSPHNPYDRRTFSGTAYYMKQALDERGDVELVVTGGHTPLAKGLLGQIKRRIHGKNAFRFRGEEFVGLDAVIAPVASHLVAVHASEIAPPVYLVTDATPAFLREFYALQVPSHKDVEEARALAEAAHVVYSSDYMASRAVREFPQLTAERAHAFPFGINLDHLPDVLPSKPPLTSLELLFIGQDWVRKGGALVLEAYRQLRSHGYDVRLTLIGAPSTEAKTYDGVEVLGYLDKNQPEDAARFAKALKRAHVFLLPTRADCTPMVVAEANSYGCPVLITDVGGVASLINEGQNGAMLPLEAGPEKWAAAVAALVDDADSYRRMSQSSFQYAHSHLTWQAWAEQMVQLIKETALS